MNFNVKELTIEDIWKWPKSIKIGVILILSCLVFRLGCYFFISPNIEKRHILAAQEKKLKSEFENLQQKAANFEAYRHQMRVMQDKFGTMLRQLPTKNEMPGLLDDISKTGVVSGLTFLLFAPAPEMTHDFYIELPIQMVVTGSYYQFAIFLSRAAELNRIITLHDFVIESVAIDKKTPGKGEQLVMKITATIYRYRTQ